MAKFQDEEVLQAAEAGKITGWSFGFRCIDDEWTCTDEYYKRRILKDIQLNEVSLLVGLTPAYAGTSYEMRGEKVELVETRSFDGMTVDVEKKSRQPFWGWKTSGNGWTWKKADISKKIEQMSQEKERSE